MLRKAFRTLSKQKNAFRGLEMPLKGVRGDQNLDGSGHESARNGFERRFSGLSKPPGALSRPPRPLSRPRNEQSRRRRALSKAPECIERTQNDSKGFGMHRKDSKGLSRTKSVIRNGRTLHILVQIHAHCRNPSLPSGPPTHLSE